MRRAFIQRKVSVIIPTYNRAKFISKALKSIENQNYENLEIIVVDDGSNDNTQDVISALQKEMPNIFYYDNERSKGPSGARNTGILRASGDYLSFLDSDDIWLKDHLKSGIEILNQYPKVGVLFGNYSVFNMHDNQLQYNFFDKMKILHTLKFIKLSPTIKILVDNLFKALIMENFFPLGSSIIRKSIMNGIFFDESLMYSEDRDFAINIFKQAKASFAYREDPLFVAYRHESNFYSSEDGSNRKQIAEAHIYLFKKYLKIYDLSNKEKRILYKQLAKKFSFLSYLYAQNYEYYKSLFCIYKSFKCCLAVL